MPKPRVIILTGYGINCDEETSFAFESAGAVSRIVHINDIILNPKSLGGYQVFAFPGGFSYGDDTGSGRALANRIKNNLLDEFRDFLARDTLMLGICNGFQVLANLGIVPGLQGMVGEAEVSLEHNRTARYQCRWVDLRIDEQSPSLFTAGMKSLHVPVAHGEGNFYAPPGVMGELRDRRLIVMNYVKPDGSPAEGEFPFNPNGSMGDTAAVCDRSGRVLGMMPHPERNILFTQRDDWTYLKEKASREGKKVPVESEGLAIFKNAVNYFK